MITDQTLEFCMFFIFGSPRSGTTIFAQCMSSHPDVIVPGETDFIAPLAMIVKRVVDPDIGKAIVSKMITGTKQFPASIGEFLSSDDVTNCVDSAEYNAAAILNSIYSKVAAKCGKRIAGDKSPNDMLVVRNLIGSDAIEASMPIIHLVRDVRDVMFSLSKVKWAPNDLNHYFARTWSERNLYLHYEGSRRENYLLLRYEDFATNPRAALEKACETIGVSYSDAMLDPGNRHKRYRTQLSHPNMFKALSDAHVGAYKNALSRQVLKEYENQAREALVQFGYMKGSFRFGF